jgi:hypothetical protein
LAAQVPADSKRIVWAPIIYQNDLEGALYLQPAQSFDQHRHALSAVINWYNDRQGERKCAHDLHDLYENRSAENGRKWQRVGFRSAGTMAKNRLSCTPINSARLWRFIDDLGYMIGKVSGNKRLFQLKNLDG